MELGAIGRLLKAVIVNPDIGSYVRLARIDIREPRYAPKIRLSQDDLDLFRGAAAQSSLIPLSHARFYQGLSFSAEVLRVWNDDIFLAILLPMLPNLTTLSVRRQGIFHADMTTMLLKNVPRVLPKFSHVHLEQDIWMRFTRDGELDSLAELPAITFLTISNFTDGYGK